MGMNIEKRRKELHLSQAELCAKVGICRTSYHLYVFKGKPIPSDKLIRLAQALDCSTDYLLGIAKYTHITVADNMGVPVAVIGNSKIVEHSNYKVLLA